MQKTIRTIKRVIKDGGIKFMRLYYISIPLILFFVLVTTLLGLGYMGKGISKEMINSVKQKINIVVYFDKNTTLETQKLIIDKIQAREDIEKIKINSKEEVLADFKERHKNDENILAALNEVGVNPFGSSLVITAKNVQDYENITTDILNLSKEYKNGNLLPVEEISYENHKQAINTFYTTLQKINSITYFLSLLLSLLLLFALYLAIRFATQEDKEEMKIMKLVGAPSLLILGPSIVMTCICGVLGAFISLGILYFLADYLSSFTLIFNNFNLLAWYIQNFKTFFFGLCLFGLVFGLLGSFLALRRHL